MDDDAQSTAETLEIGADESEEEEGDDLGTAPPRHRWLASGGKDRRVALWGLMDFTKAGDGI